MFRSLNRVFVMIVVSSSVVCASEGEFKKIFNGEDFEGWDVPTENLWWTIYDGVLKGKNDPEQQPSILWTKKEYGDFKLKFDFRIGEGRVDSGVYLRSLNEQIQIGDSGKRKRDMTCSPYIKSKKDYPVEAEGVAELLKPRDWNTMEITAKGANYIVSLNGKQVLDYTSETAAKQGPIGVQVHIKREMEIEYKNILLAEISSDSREK